MAKRSTYNRSGITANDPTRTCHCFGSRSSLYESNGIWLLLASISPGASFPKKSTDDSITAFGNPRSRLMLRVALGVLIALACVDVALALPAPCNQVDQAEQTRCQIASAIATNNNALMKRIFETSPYADINDEAACGGAGYLGCAMNSYNLAAAEYLFSIGFDPDWKVTKSGYPLVATPVHLAIGQQDDFVVALFGLFIKKGASLDALIPHIDLRFGEPTVVNFVMGKCMAPHMQYPRFNRLIRAAIENNPSNVPSAKESFAAIKKWLASHQQGMDVQNCTDMANWVNSH